VQTSSISVVIPTLDRPGLLLEAIESAVRQSRAPAEIIVVDDASNPPVDHVALAKRFGSVVRVIRNASSQGLAWSRRQGVDAAIGDYVAHLDDDDMYTPDLLASSAALLDADPELKLVFIGVCGFGSGAEHFNRVHPLGVAKVIAQGAGVAVGDLTYAFDGRLVHGLLNQVPMPFQRVMARRTAWLEVSALRLAAYRRAFGLASDVQARDLIRGTLRDSEWAVYAALACSKLALANKPLYLQRCENQGRSSQPAMQYQHTLQAIAIKSVMNIAAVALPEMQPHRARIRENLAKLHFDAAYAQLNAGSYRSALAHLRVSFVRAPGIRHMKLITRICIAAVTGGLRAGRA
jgi:glycosyltransferase involved in cell wall biosynthesis